MLEPGDTVRLPLTLTELPDDRTEPCDFCSTVEHQAVAMERLMELKGDE